MSGDTLPAYLVRRPALPADAVTLRAFDDLYRQCLAHPGAEIAYSLPVPVWQFLCHLTDTQNVLLHGSGNPDITMFEPRKADDVNEFGDRKAVYAASDGLWPMYFAILDRQHWAMSLINSSARLELDGGQLSEPHYFFSITKSALDHRPFRRGTIYLLPRDSFEQQPPLDVAGHRVHLAHWASPVPVKPLAKLSVGPEDFPLLDAIRGHDDEATFARARANPDGFPWLDEAASAA